jgi:hypothetical protein
MRVAAAHRPTSGWQDRAEPAEPVSELGHEDQTIKLHTLDNTASAGVAGHVLRSSRAAEDPAAPRLCGNASGGQNLGNRFRRGRLAVRPERPNLDPGRDNVAVAKARVPLGLPAHHGEGAEASRPLLAPS